MDAQTRPVTDTLVIGMGAIGAFYAYILEKSGRTRVTAIARGNYEALKESGFTMINTDTGDVANWRPHRLMSSLDQALDRTYAFVVLATKAIPEVTTTRDVVAPLLGLTYDGAHPQPAFVFMQNGIDVEEDIYVTLSQKVPSQNPRLISTALWVHMHMRDSVTVEYNNFGHIDIGDYLPPTVDRQVGVVVSPVATEFSETLKAGGTKVVLTADIGRLKYMKNAWNLCFNMVPALTRLSCDAIFGSPDTHIPPAGLSAKDSPQDVPLTSGSPGSPEGVVASLPRASPLIGDYTIPMMLNLLFEVYDLGSLLYPPTSGGPNLDHAAALSILTVTAKAYASGAMKHVPSTLADVRAGRPIELEVILGSVVRLGRQRGMAQPVSAMLDMVSCG
ncbi:uncharacterized protein B0H18DRAFT_980920 [Fomitopsis serialis]|uniref:uncharacterized protein n=1 Tax=Fomitopsis serialis TaxID=139415 RepID=UPI002007965B|nr:uncharacterized protein B0H18DRAFT_980920 [Neoantrodia serialis]KAH9934314.1 hypothetical protein B0H18DRAFT_980920 [Neoantrodia serialis]